MDFAILDDLGYLPFAQVGGQLLFQPPSGHPGADACELGRTLSTATATLRPSRMRDSLRFRLIPNRLDFAIDHRSAAGASTDAAGVAAAVEMLTSWPAGHCFAAHRG